MSTMQQYTPLVTVGALSLGAFDSFTGGNVTAEPTKRRSGGSRLLKQYGVLPDYEDVTVVRVRERERDHEVSRQLAGLCGFTLGTVVDQPLDANQVPWGKPITYAGMLMTVNFGESDVTNKDTRMLTLVFQISAVR